MSREDQKEIVELTKQAQFLTATNESQLKHITELVKEIERLEEKIDDLKVDIIESGDR